MLVRVGRRVCSCHTRCNVSAPKQARRTFSLPRLAYPLAAGVPPVFSAKAAKEHFDVVNRNYVVNLNLKLEGHPSEERPLEEIVVMNQRYSENALVYNHAATVYNHLFMWLSICPGGQAMTPWFQNIIETHFGTVERLRQLWLGSCKTVKGSGWTWLIDNDGELEIFHSINSGNPLGLDSTTPLLVIDLWEHAYIMDYGNNVVDYVNNWWKAVNWGFVEFEYRRIIRNKRVTPHPSWKWMPVPEEPIDTRNFPPGPEETEPTE